MVTRPWHWGIAVLSDPSLGDVLPDVEPATPVTANDNAAIVLVRHAQDLDPGDDGADEEWAVATPTSRLELGDADACSHPDRPRHNLDVAHPGRLERPRLPDPGVGRRVGIMSAVNLAAASQG